MALLAFWSDDKSLAAFSSSPVNLLIPDQILAKKKRGPFLVVPASNLHFNTNQRVETLEAHCCASVEITTLPVQVVLETI